MWSRAVAWVLGAVLSGCYVPAYDIRIHRPGDTTARNAEDLGEQAHGLPWDQQYPVQVHRGLVPEGLALSDDGHHIAIAPSHAAEWEFLADVHSTRRYNTMAKRFGVVLWRGEMHEQHSSGRATYCDVQAPLRLLTLSLWNFVPFSWPCWGKYPESAEAVEVHLSNLVRATMVVGGNTLLVGTVQSQSDTAVLYTSDMLIVHPVREGEVTMTGFALRHRARVPQPQQPSLPARQAALGP
jgi:hypothetical protein